MEPGHEDREYKDGWFPTQSYFGPQWSPVMKTGNTDDEIQSAADTALPQWSPVMKTGNT